MRTHGYQLFCTCFPMDFLWFCLLFAWVSFVLACFSFGVPLGLLVCGAYKHIHTMEEKRMQKTNKKYRTKKLLLLVFPFSFLSVLVLVLLLLLLFSHLLPISLSLSLSLTYLSASHKAATKASEIATTHGAVLLDRRPPAQPARAQQHCWSWLPDDRYQRRQTLLEL